MKVDICCDDFMEIKGITLNKSNGCGFSGYAVVTFCSMCGEFKILKVPGNEQEDLEEQQGVKDE